MAKVTITIKDLKTGNASVVLDPDVQTLIKMVKSAEKITEAQKLALRSVASIMMTPEEYNREVTKRNAEKAGLVMPSGGLF